MPRSDFWRGVESLPDAASSRTALGVAASTLVVNPTAGIGSGAYTSLAAAYAAASPGDTISLAGNVLVTSAIEVTKGLRWRGNGYTVTQLTAGTRVLRITTQAANNTDIRDFKFVGQQYGVRNSNEKAIEVVGTYLAPISGVKIIDNEFESWGETAVVLTFCTKYCVRGNKVLNAFYGGIIVISSTYGDVSFNTVDGVWATGLVGANAYGISFSRFDSDSLVTDPRCTSALCSFNTILNIPTWEGLDTHGGQGINFSNNNIYNTSIGIAIGESANGSGVYTWAPVDCSAVNNTIDSLVITGTRNYAINVTGCTGGGIGSPGALASGCKVQGNVIRGHGIESSTIGTAIYCRDTIGISVCNNEIIEPGASGINFYYDNYGFTCTGNVVVDPWSNTVGIAEGVGIWAARSDYNYGHLSGNSVVRGTKVATYVCTGGIGTAGGTNQAFTVGVNYLQDCAAPIRDTSALLTFKAQATRLAFYNQTPGPILPAPLPAAATDLASAIALVNRLRTDFQNNGLEH